MAFLNALTEVSTFELVLYLFRVGKVYTSENMERWWSPLSQATTKCNAVCRSSIYNVSISFRRLNVAAAAYGLVEFSFWLWLRFYSSFDRSSKVEDCWTYSRRLDTTPEKVFYGLKPTRYTSLFGENEFSTCLGQFLGKPFLEWEKSNKGLGLGYFVDISLSNKSCQKFNDPDRILPRELMGNVCVARINV